MTDFEAFLSRHGEVSVLAMLENWERFRGIKHSHLASLEQRWNTFMRETASPARLAA
ncbi:MAG: hypothetical protein PHX43_07225 [Alphaproteobacteria bacterium]|nr:hypothetical protein [Alphaproteobacteria bacterium]